MSFSKAPIKRFNDCVKDTPGPDAYDVKDLLPKGAGIALVKSDRFVVPKDVTPGPGQYDVAAGTTKKPVIKKALYRSSSLRGGRPSSSRTSSTSSLQTEGDEMPTFSTPSNRPENHEKIMSDLLNLKSEMAKKCEEADEVKASLTARINQLQEKVSAIESEMSAKVAEIENIEKDRREELEKAGKLGDELAQVQARKKSLEEELETLKQANSGLEDRVELSTRSLMEEKRALEEKSTFLHFTQEQLNIQVEILEGEKQKLEKEVEELRTRVADLENELTAERAKLKEITDMYVLENSETQVEFMNLTKQIEELTQKNTVFEEASVKLEIEIKNLRDHLCIVEESKTKSLAKLAEIESDIEVLTNDKEVLESERKRIDAEKNELSLDLMAVSCEKMTLEKTLATLNVEKSDLDARLNAAISEKTRLTEELEICTNELATTKERLSSLEALIESNGISNKESESIICDLRSEIVEMEMKNSSLEGSLCAAQNEVANLETENKALLNSFEKVEETVRGYIHKCKDLEIMVSDLSASKADLNATCVILEERMKFSERLAEENANYARDFEARFLEKDEMANKLKKDVAAYEKNCRELKELISLLEQRHATCQEIAQETESALHRQISELEDNLAVTEERADSAETDLSNIKADYEELMSLNVVLSQQVSDSLSSVQSLTAREEELNRRLEKAHRDLDAAQQGISLETGQRWEAEDEILHLQTELDQSSAILHETQEQFKNLEIQLRERSKELSDLSKLKSSLEGEHSKAKAKRDEVIHDLHLAKQQNIESKSKLEAEIDSRLKLERQLAFRDESENALKEQLETAETELSKLTLQSQNWEKVIKDQSHQIKTLQDELEGVELLATKFEEREQTLIACISEMKEMEAKEELLMAEIAKKDALIDQLRTELDPLQETSQSYKDKYEALLQMIEPFREQLESYEVEKSALLSQNDEAEGKIHELATQYTKLLGHQNHKQKIHHLVKLKEDVIKKRELIAKLQLENSKLRRTIMKLESCSASNRTKFSSTIVDKENDESVFYTPMSHKTKTPIAASTPHLRRQTIASPLMSRNRP